MNFTACTEERWNRRIELATQRTISSEKQPMPHQIVPESLVDVVRDKTSEALIASFVPRLLQNELETYTSYTPHCRVFSAVCLVVDIVGFIPHVSRNGSRGEQGLVQLTTLTNAFVSSLVSRIITHGGDVIELSSGSTLISIFHPTDKTRKSYLHSCKKAVQCAWDLNERSSLDLDIRTGISFGELSLGLLGGFDNTWRFLIAGQCKHEIATALQNQNSKTLIVSKVVKDLLREDNKQQDHSGDDMDMSNHDDDINFDPCIMDKGFFMVKIFKTKVTQQQSSTRPLRTRSTLHDVTRQFSSGSVSKNDNEAFDYYTQLCSFVPRPVVQSSINLLFDSMSCIEEVTVLFVRMDGYKGMDDHIHQITDTVTLICTDLQHIMYTHINSHIHKCIPTYTHTYKHILSNKQPLTIPFSPLPCYNIVSFHGQSFRCVTPWRFDHLTNTFIQLSRNHC